MVINKGEFVALIPARGGSKGVPRKNIKDLGGFPLIAYTIAACLQSEMISRIIVSTDDEEIAEIAKEFGAEVPFLRPKELASDRSTDYEFVDHAISWLDENEGSVAEFLVHMRPTTPLREYRIVDNALKLFKDAEQYTSLRSAHAAPESPYKWFLKTDDGTFACLSARIDNEEANAGRAEFPIAYVPDGYVDVLKTGFVRKSKRLHGEMMMAFESPYCVEVDTVEEFELLEYYIDRRSFGVFEYLKSNSKRA